MLGALPIAAAVQAPSVTVPAAAIVAAQMGALPLAALLATHSVPVSVITTDNPSAIVPIRIGPGDTAAVTLDAVIAKFQANHAKDTVAFTDGVLRIEPPDLTCSRALDRIKLKPTSLDTDTVRALVMLGWLGSGDPPPAHAATIGALGAPPDDALAQPPKLPIVHLPIADGLPLRAAFDAVVKQSKGGAWIVWQHVRDDGATGCRIVSYFSNGQAGGSMKDFAVVK
jgi:hypothetical protein